MGEGHCCDGPIVLCSTVVRYLDLYIGTCHLLIVPHVYGSNEGEVEGRERRVKERGEGGEEERQEMEGKINTTLWMGREGRDRREEIYLVEEQRVFSWVGGRVEGVQWLAPAVLLTYLL